MIENNQDIVSYDDFCKAFKTLSDYLNLEIKDTQLNVYYTFLKHYQLDDIKGTIAHLIKTYKYNTLPKIADFLDFLEAKKYDLDTEAILSYDLAIKTAEKLSNNSVSFDNNVINLVISNLGGWHNFGLREQNDFLRNDFIRIYKAFKNSDCANESLTLISFYDSENIKNGYVNKRDLEIYCIENNKKIIKKKLLELGNKQYQAKAILLLAEKGLI